MFERFSGGARRTVVLAQEEARALDHNYIGTEHILLGLLREHDGVAAQALSRLGITVGDVRGDVIRIIGKGAKAPSGHVPFTPRAKKVLELSLREALQLGHNYIGTEHILLGLIREGEGVAAQVLVARGADLEVVRAIVLHRVGRGGEGPTRSRPEHTPGAEEALSAAGDIAAGGPVGSQHLLEALARSEEGLAGKVLASLGVDADAIAARIDELGVDGTSDVTPDVAAAQQMEVRVDGDEVHVVLRDEVSLDLVRAMSEPFGGPIRGDDPAAGSLVVLRRAIVAALEDLRRQLAPPPAEEGTEPGRARLVSRAVQSRFARRRPR